MYGASFVGTLYIILVLAVGRGEYVACVMMSRFRFTSRLVHSHRTNRRGRGIAYKS